MVGTLLKREFKGGYKLLIIFLAVLSMYGGMITAMYDPKLGESLKMMAESMPDLFAAFGMLDAGSSMIEFISNYLYGFLLVVFPLVFIILLSSRLMARYIDRGSMAYLLATPHKRSKIALTEAVTMVLFLLILCTYVTGFVTLVSEGMFKGELDIQKYMFINVGWFGLLLFLGGICFCSACVFNDSKFALGIGGGVCIAFVLFQMVSQVGDKFEALKYATPLTLFDTGKIIAGDESSIWLCALLYVSGLIFYSIGILVFSKKDLSI